MDTKMLIGSALRGGDRDGGERPQPADRREHHSCCPKPRKARSTAPSPPHASAFAAWSQHHACAALRLPAEDRRPRSRPRPSAFAALEALNCGKPINAVRNDEMPAIVDCFRFFAGAVRCMPGNAAGEYMPGITSMIRRDPIGVVASIAPWNYPLMMMAWKLAPAIAGGNTVVFKPSEQTPLTALKMATLLADVLPEGVVNVVLGRGESVGNALINHPKVDMISITGDVATGKKVLAGRRQDRSSARIWNWAARPPSSSSTTPISKPSSMACAPSATTMPARTAPPPAASTPRRRSTTISSPTCPPPSPPSPMHAADDSENEIGPLISMRQRDRVASFVQRAIEQNHMRDHHRRQGA